MRERERERERVTYEGRRNAHICFIYLKCNIWSFLAVIRLHYCGDNDASAICTPRISEYVHDIMQGRIQGLHE